MASSEIKRIRFGNEPENQISFSVQRGDELTIVITGKGISVEGFYFCGDYGGHNCDLGPVELDWEEIDRLRKAQEG